MALTASHACLLALLVLVCILPLSSNAVECPLYGAVSLPSISRLRGGMSPIGKGPGNEQGSKKVSQEEECSSRSCARLREKDKNWIATLKAKNGELEEKNATLSADLLAIERDLKEIVGDRKKSNEEIDRLAEENQRLDDENDLLKRAIADLQKERAARIHSDIKDGARAKSVGEAEHERDMTMQRLARVESEYRRMYQLRNEQDCLLAEKVIELEELKDQYKALNRVISDMSGKWKGFMKSTTGGEKGAISPDLRRVNDMIERLERLCAHQREKQGAQHFLNSQNIPALLRAGDQESGGALVAPAAPESMDLDALLRDNECGADQNPREVLDVLISEVKRVLFQRDVLMVEQRKVVLQKNQVEELQRRVDREREDIQTEREKLFEEQRQLGMIREAASS